MTPNTRWTEPLYSVRDALEFLAKRAVRRDALACDGRWLAKALEHQRKDEWVGRRAKSL